MSTDDAEADTKPELSLLRKFLFGLAAPPLQMSSNVVGFFFNIFMLEVAKVPPYFVSVILFVGRAWDAVTDPMAGHLVSKTNTRLGKTRPWMMIANPIGCAMFFILWIVLFPVTEDYNGAKFAYYLVVYLLYCTLITCYHVPYTSSTMLIARQSTDKDAATAFRMSFELLGTIVGVGLFGIIISTKRIAASCGSSREGQITVEEERSVYMIGAAVIVGIFFLCGLAGSFGIKEKYAEKQVSDDSFFSNVKAVLTFRPYVLLMFAFLFMSLAVQMVQTNLALYTTHSLGLGDHTSYGILCVLGIAILAIPLWNRMIQIFGKKNIFAVGVVMFIPCLLCAMLVPRDVVWAFYLVMSVSGFAISISMLLPWSMLPDVIDDYFLKHGTRREATFYSLYVFFNKFAVGFSMAASQITMSLVGYDSSPEACEQSYEVGLALRYLVGPGPIVCLLASLSLIYTYPIDKQYRQELSVRLSQFLQRQDSRQDIVDESKSTGISGSTGNSSFENEAYQHEEQLQTTGPVGGGSEAGRSRANLDSNL
ncbi:hypothetical protein BOX15_Mlig014320g2 [Macrostomum lignano]|uniref:MFS domain-containing protein n=1 Tax=Macrostomum lignano TaxID=282301 RepID=A0A267E5S9_9PLAT|nr:hypothetical protein BOX15_Mlig014320g2 [Macrostomum lignano]